jgi:hypothetical protein
MLMHLWTELNLSDDLICLVMWRMELKLFKIQFYNFNFNGFWRSQSNLSYRVPNNYPVCIYSLYGRVLLLDRGISELDLVPNKLHELSIIRLGIRALHVFCCYEQYLLPSKCAWISDRKAILRYQFGLRLPRDLQPVHYWRQLNDPFYHLHL